MKTIEIKYDKTAIVDDERYELLSTFNWHVDSCGYARRYIKVNGNQKTVFMHHDVIGRQSGRVVDHINGDKMDNRFVNLRMATNAENMRNRGAQTNNTAGYKGVRKLKNVKTNQYQAYIRVFGKQITLGRFDNNKLAAAAYNKAAAHYFEEYARLNEI